MRKRIEQGAGASEVEHGASPDEAKELNRLFSSKIMSKKQLASVEVANYKKAQKISRDMTNRMKLKFRTLWGQAKKNGISMVKFVASVELMEEFTKDYAPNIVAGVTEERIAAGEDDAASSPFIIEMLPYRLYIATHDDRVRETHLMLERSGLNRTAVYRADDPVWKLFRPPWQISCRCTFIPLSVIQASNRGVSEAIAWRKRAKKQRKPLIEVPPIHPEHVEFPTYGGVPISPEFF